MSHVGRHIGRYRILEQLGQGGMSVVYKGLDTALDREVAVKVLHPHLASQQDARERFQREAKAVAKLRHPNILDIFDYSGADSPESYIVVELIHGPTLKRFVEGARSSGDAEPRSTPARDGVGRVPIEVAAMIVHEVCGAVAAAHAQGIIHRDIKPENVMIREDGVLKLTDFGIAQILDANSMTVTGQILGSPAHMAPEQIDASEVDFRTDVWSVGTVLYYLAAGRLPFEGKNPHHLLKKIMDGDYPDPIRVEPAMGERLAGIIRKSLARKREGRHDSAEALQRELGAFLADLEVADPSAELKRYFKDPGAYATAHRERIVKILVRRGQEEKKKGQLPIALDYFNRVLAIDEHNREVLRIVGGIERRQTFLRAAGAAVLIAALGAGSGLAWRALASSEPPRPVEERADDGEDVAPPDEGSIDQKGTAAIQPETSRPAKARNILAKMVPASPIAKQTTRLVRFSVGNCLNVRVVLDGTELGQFSTVATRELAIGPHTVAFLPNSGARCGGRPFPFVVREGPGEQFIPSAIQWEAARVEVQASISAHVTIGRTEGMTNEMISVPMSEEEARVRLLVEADGHLAFTKMLNLTAGGSTQERVTLQTAEGQPSSP